jgi:hypothetical protein
MAHSFETNVMLTGIAIPNVYRESDSAVAHARIVPRHISAITIPFSGLLAFSATFG